MEKERNENKRFYILLLILLWSSVIITYFNYTIENAVVIPSINSASYDRILKHTRLLKNKKKFT
tara:strand:- start:30 stop:221 length:192 start_codon:yes stop_codon:yes gene_type:complete